MKELTRAEEQVMQVLWRLEKAFVKDIVEAFPEPKPAYTTVSTIIRILERKGFVSHRPFGKTYEYFTRISKDEYKKKFLKSFVRRYFGDSLPEMVSFFASGRDLSIEELEELQTLLRDEIRRQKAGAGGEKE